MTAKTTGLNTHERVEFVSAIEAVGNPISLSGLSKVHPHTFVTFEFFGSDDQDDPAVPSAGTLTVTVRLSERAGYEGFTDNVLTLTGATRTVSVAAPVDSILCTPAAIATATHYRAVVNQMRL